MQMQLNYGGSGMLTDRGEAVLVRWFLRPLAWVMFAGMQLGLLAKAYIWAALGDPVGGVLLVGGWWVAWLLVKRAQARLEAAG